MRIKNMIYGFAIALVFGAYAASTVSAQVVQATGRVMLRQADGTEAPLQGATVTFYRTDIRGRYETRTSRDGRYVYAAIPFGGTFTIVVSGPGARPTYSAGIRVNQQPENNFTLEPGDGSTVTLEQVQAAAAASGGANAGGGGGDSAAARRAREEEARIAAANEEARRNAAATTAQLNEVLRNANTAIEARNYDQAITLYDQGIQAAPDEPVFHRNRAIALQSRGVQRYNAASSNTNPAERTAARTPALEDLRASVESSERAVTLYRASTASRGAGTPAGGAAQPAQNDMLGYLSIRADGYRIALQTGAQVSPDAAATAIQEYVAAETDPVKRDRAQIGLGSALLQSGKTEEAITLLRGIVSANANNADAIYYLGIALVSDETKQAEARTVFQQFLSRAPANDARRAEVEALIESIQPARPTPGTNTNRGRRRGN